MRLPIAALTGALAALTGTAAGHLVAALTDPAASPVLAVGSAVVDATPTPVKDWAIATLGTADKPVLIGSVALGALLLAALAGILARRLPWLGLAMILALTAAPALAVAAAPGFTPVELLPSVAAALVGGTLFAWLVGLLRAPECGERAAGVLGPSRRALLITAVAAAAVGATGQWIASARTKISDLVLPRAKRPLARIPTGLDDRIDGISPFVTPNDDFYRVDTRLSLPVVDPEDWTLTIDGDVPREVSYTYADLRERDLVERDITMTCVSNDVGGRYVGAARWLGVPVTELLREAGIRSADDTGADQILSTDVDGMTISTPLAAVLDGREPLVALGMNGEVLPVSHGFPARLVTPGLYGYVGSTKWVTRLTLTTYDAEQAYWTQRDWATEGPIKIASRIDTPTSSIEAGEQVIAGVAWAQQRGIARVELQIDGSAWQETTLGPDAGIDYWRQWYFRWEAAAGVHRLAVRAIGEDGEVQPAVRAEPFPNGSSGIQEVVVTVT